MVCKVHAKGLSSYKLGKKDPSIRQYLFTSFIEALIAYFNCKQIKDSGFNTNTWMQTQFFPRQAWKGQLLNRVITGLNFLWHLFGVALPV